MAWDKSKNYVGSYKCQNQAQKDEAYRLYSNLCACLPPYYAELIQQPPSGTYSSVDWRGKRYLVTQEDHVWLLMRDVCETVGEHFLRLSEMAGKCYNYLQELQNLSDKKNKLMLEKALYSMTEKEQLDSDDYKTIENLMNEIKKGDCNEDDDEQ